jgi:hypothetical protein
MTTDGFNLKLYLEGSGTDTFPANPGSFTLTEKTITIPHGYGSDELIFQASIDGVAIPFTTFVGSLQYSTMIDDTNLYISRAISSAGSASSFDFTYSYRLLIP